MLLVAADLHLDAGASLGRLADQESSWRRFCTTAAEMQVTVLWAGDSHHHRKPSPAAIAAWQSGLEILREGGCELIGLVGNHCVASEDLPSTLEVASAGYDCEIFRAPGCARTEDGGVAFLPWAPPRLNAREAGEALMTVAADLAERGARILIAHHAIAGGSLPTGLPVLDLAEPVLDPHALAAMGYEVVIAGHIHRRQVILDDGVSLIAQCGPLARVNFGERDCETGGWQIDRRSGQSYSWADGGAPERLTATPFDIPDRRFVVIEGDGRYHRDALTEGLINAIPLQDVEGAIVRMRWTQTSEQVVDTVAVLAALQEAGAHRIDRLEPVIERVASVRSGGLTEASDPREAFDGWLDLQGDVAGEETLATVRETAHERIGAA